MIERTNTKVSLYYSRRNPRGGLTIVRNTRRPTMMESLSTPYAQGIYTGAAGVGLVTGMAMIGSRRRYERAIDLAQQANFAKWSGRPSSTEESSTFVRRSKTGKIGIVKKKGFQLVSKQSSDNPLPIIRNWEDIKRDPFGISPIVNYSKRLRAIAAGDRKAIALQKRDPWGMKAFDRDGM